MPSASAIRSQIEAALAPRIPSALTPKPRILRPRTATGIAELDALLDGGLPIGAISELVGPECSGRTSVALSLVAQRTSAGNVCAWVDGCDGLDPESAAAAGIDLRRLLWVRCGRTERTAPPGAGSSFRLPEKYFAPAAAKKGLHGGGFGPHPRTEGKGMPEAIGGWLRPESVAARCAEPLPRPRRERESIAPVSPHPVARANRRNPSETPWKRMEQVLRATDLLLQAGGFAAIVLDLAGLAPEHVSRVPLATWFRYRAAAERAQSALVLLTQYPCTKSGGEVLLRFEPGEPRCDEPTVFAGMTHRVETERQRFAEPTNNLIWMRKPPRRETGAQWRMQCPWTGTR